MTRQGALGIVHRPIIVLLGAALAICAALNAARSAGHQGGAYTEWWLQSSPASLIEAEANRTDPGWLASNAAQVGRNARDVLRHEPLDAVSLRLLAELSPNSPGKMRDLLRLSERVTRRDTTGQILQINLAAEANDFGEAVAHYDRAISVLPRLGPALLPYLSNGLTDPEVVKVLPRFATRPWFRPLLAVAIEQGAPISAVAELALAARAHLAANDRQAQTAELVDRLLALQRHDDIRALVLQLGGAQRAILDDLAINSATTDLRSYPLSWRLTEDGTVGTELLPPASLAITVSPAGAGAAATRVSLLKVGTYGLKVRLTYDQGAPRASLTWVVECFDGRSIWKAELPNDRESVSIDASIAIPQGCSQQTWRLDARASDSQFASVARIAALSLHPL